MNVINNLPLNFKRWVEKHGLEKEIEKNYGKKRKNIRKSY